MIEDQDHIKSETRGKFINQTGKTLKEANEDPWRNINYINSIPTPVVAVDKDLNIELINKAGADTVNRPIDECIGRKCYDLLKTPHCHTDECRVQQAMSKDGVFTADNLANLPTGKLPIRYTGAPLKNEAGDTIGAIEYIIDITDEMKVVDLAESISQGDTSTRTEKRSEDDRLSDAINKMVDTINDVATQADVISSGDYSTDIKPRSDKDNLGIALQKMTETLRAQKEKDDEYKWTSDGLAGINEIFRNETHINDLSKRICTYLAKCLKFRWQHSILLTKTN